MVDTVIEHKNSERQQEFNVFFPLFPTLGNERQDKYMCTYMCVYIYINIWIEMSKREEIK